MNVSPWWGGLAGVVALELRPSGATRQPTRVKPGAQHHN
nr:MAG TPA: hypothetical protein [Caudoviricetes sp.]